MGPLPLPRQDGCRLIEVMAMSPVQSLVNVDLCCHPYMFYEPQSMVCRTTVRVQEGPKQIPDQCKAFQKGSESFPNDMESGVAGDGGGSSH